MAENPGTFILAVRNTDQQHMTEVTISEDDLLRRSAVGDEDAFVALYRRRHAGIFRFALHMSGNSALAEEVTQDVFLTVIRDGSRFDASRGSAAAYLFGVARNQVLKHLERDRPYVAMDEEMGPPAAPVDLTRAETIETVRQAVLSLPAGYRETVVLCDLEEMSYAEVAAALDVPIGTVRSRLSRGRGLLLDKLTRCFA